MNAVRHTFLLKIVLVLAVLGVLYALFAPPVRAAQAMAGEPVRHAAFA